MSRYKTSIIASTKSQFSSSFFFNAHAVILIFSNCPLKFFFWQTDAEIPRLQCYHLSTPFVMLFNDKIIVPPPCPSQQVPLLPFNTALLPNNSTDSSNCNNKVDVKPHLYSSTCPKKRGKKSHFLCSHPKHIFYDLLYTLTWNFHTGSYHP